MKKIISIILTVGIFSAGVVLTLHAAAPSAPSKTAGFSSVMSGSGSATGGY